MAHNPETTVRKIFTLPRDLWERTEDYRFSMRLKTEAEAIRRLMELGLSASEAPEAGPSPRELEEQAEINRRGGAGWIAHEGILAGLNGGDPNSCPYVTPLAREIWLKGYIRGQADRLQLRPAEVEAAKIEAEAWLRTSNEIQPVVEKRASKPPRVLRNMMKPED